MIKEAQIEITIMNDKMAEYYEKLGYQIPRREDGTIPKCTKINIKTKHLGRESAKNIIAICDNRGCDSELSMTRKMYHYHTSELTGFYYCPVCKPIKNKLISKLNLKNKVLKRGDPHYWSFKQNILKELQIHIQTHGTINGLQMLDSALRSAIDNHKLQVLDLVFELGIDISSVTKYKIDHRGDHNRSMMEVYFANWLVAQGFKDYYDRDVIIDKSAGQYNSDFRLKLKDSDKELRIEVWGYDEHTNGHYKDTYMERKLIKKELYEKHKDTMILISLEPFDMTTNDRMQQTFYEKLSPYLKLPFEKIDWKQIKCYDQLSEEEFVEELMQYGTDGRFPTKTELLERGTSRLTTYAQKIGGLTYLARKYGYESYCKHNYWNESTVIELFIYMHDKYKKFLKNAELDVMSKEDKYLVGFLDYTKENKGMMYWKIRLCDYLLTNNKKLELFDEVKYLHRMSAGKNRKDNERTAEHKDLAQKILNKFNIE